MTKDKAIKMAIEAWDNIDTTNQSNVECARNWFIEGYVQALEQPAEPRLVSYAPDGSTCTLNIDGEEVYFNREQPAQEPVSDDEIMNIWLFCEGKVAGLNETGFDCKFPVIFSRALLEFINAKQ